VDANHGLIVKTFGEEMKNNIKSPFEKQLTKKTYNECKCNL
jgi:hypothetical protein